MLTIIRSMSAPVLTSLLVFSPSIALAAESSASSFLPPAWPLIALFIIVVVFRKQLNCAPSFEQQANSKSSVEATSADLPTQQEEPVHTEEPVQAKAEQTPSPMEAVLETADSIEHTDTETQLKIIDLKDGSKRCQAKTLKGARCKRKTQLEDTSVTIGNTRYLLTACKQHISNRLEPFAALLK